MQTPVMIFDFDGTIADTHHYMVALCNRLAPEFGYDLIPQEDIEALRDKSAIEIIQHLQIPMLKVPSIVRKAKRLFRDGISTIKLIDGMHDALHDLQRDGVRLGILSSNDRENIETFLDLHDIHVFDFIQGARTIWGKHHSLRKLIAREKIDSSSVYYVGDESRDVAAARQAHVISVAVAWGCNSHQHLVAANPDHLLSAPSELPALCRGSRHGSAL
jgi:phosphoglycolate phosphatase-like HAD superfamily hydrolase